MRLHQFNTLFAGSTKYARSQTARTVGRRNNSAGVTLLELVAVIFMLALMATILVPLAEGFIDVQRSNTEGDELKGIYAAIVGDPNSNIFGYLGDVGSFPLSLMDLVQQPASNPPGWNGPYISNVRIDIVSSMLYDTFG